MKLISSSKLIINKSVFFGNLYEINEEKEIKPLLKQLQQKYKKANHHCYGAIINNEKIFKNDGEVGFPGKIILNLLIQKKLNNHILIVSRIFGGKKLGVSNVSKTFKETAKLTTKDL